MFNPIVSLLIGYPLAHWMARMHSRLGHSLVLMAVIAPTIADGGKSWAEAALSQLVLPKAVTRFRIPWNWDGGPAVLQSRVTDSTGYVQPTRAKMIADRSLWSNYHGNCITTWSVDPKGEVRHVYA